MNFIGITMGDPAGVGPEIIVKALNSGYPFQSKQVVYGSAKVLSYYNKMLGGKLGIHVIRDFDEYQDHQINVFDIVDLDVSDFKIGEVAGKCGDAAFRYIEKSIQDALQKKITAVVTAPLNKQALHLGGHCYDGHTEIFAKLTGTKKYAMMFIGPLNIIHVSTHVSLREACDRVKKERILDVIQLADDTLKKLNISDPKIAVAGLNPHAGEGGLFGREEIDEIVPAVDAARALNIHVEGPLPPDSVFSKAAAGIYDAVVAMYHDQGHIAEKLQWVNEGVNVTVGLPIIRTSVDHGTAFDIAGKGIANEKNMIEAMKVAEMFSKNQES